MKEGGLVTATDNNVDKLFDGVLITVSDPFVGRYVVPGWQCRACGWRVGAQGLPPKHRCPDEGQRQLQRNRNDRDTSQTSTI